MNTLFKKGYLLAGVIMAANMFVVNEMKASEEERIHDLSESYNSINPIQFVKISRDIKVNKEMKSSIQQMQGADPNILNGKKEIKNLRDSKTGQKNKKKSGEQSFFGFLLSHKNLINLIGGLALSGANNYFKWWDYNPGKYQELGCRGWRSKRLLNDIFQFEINLNGIRGLLWLIPGIIEGRRRDTKAKNEISKLNTSDKVVSFIIFILHFVSMPLTVHLSNFSISISLDSIICGIIGKILEPKGEKGKEKIKPVRIVKKIDN